MCICLVHTKLAGIHFALCIALCTALCTALCIAVADVCCFCGHLVQGVGLPWFCLVPALCNTEIVPLAFWHLRTAPNFTSSRAPCLHKLKSEWPHKARTSPCTKQKYWSVALCTLCRLGSPKPCAPWFFEFWPCATLCTPCARLFFDRLFF